ncbi:BLUF domain-containing protein [Ekhidna sp.]|uniref:BLUF domain-containing protein n=1 Tax=Ekhidna sp. TaxID=2608089 RepID=UPI003B502096
MIFYLIYTSKPRIPMTVEIVDEITHASIRNNKVFDITGMLLAIEGHYLQYLEGGKKDVLNLLKIIKQDARHKDLVVWVQGFYEERVFSEWSMGSWMLSNEKLEKLTALADVKNFLNDPSNTELQTTKFIHMMNGLLNTWIAHEPERVSKLKNGTSG